MKKYKMTFTITLFCLAIEIVCQMFPGLRDVLAFNPGAGPLGWLGLVTHMFAHGGWQHFFGNFTFGIPFMAFLESKLGSEGLKNSYFACGIGGTLLNWLIEGPVSMIGASGALFGMMTLACMLFGDTKAEKYMARSLFLVMFIPQLAMAPFSFLVGIGFYAHVGGALTALLLLTLKD